MSPEVKECLVRSARTFVQASLGFAAANMFVAFDGGVSWKSALLGLAASSVAAGLAAIMNLPKEGDGNGKAV